jgi:hypothetical protein
MRYAGRRCFGRVVFFCGCVCLLATRAIATEPSTEAVAGFDSCLAAVETRLAGQHRNNQNFLAGEASRQEGLSRLRRGEVIVEQIAATIPNDSGAMIHHWRGTAFAPGAKEADFEGMIRAFDKYPQVFFPEVVAARETVRQGDRIEVKMRLRQKHVMTVVMDLSYDISFGRLDGQHGYSVSRSTRIAEIEAAGTPNERALRGDEEHGFLWRLNTYWSYEEGDGGLYMQIESVSLTRSIPRGLGWAVGPFVESVPRESLEFTLTSVCNALRKHVDQEHQGGSNLHRERRPL